MLAVARIGAIHSVVFGGFSSDSLASRIDDAEAKLVITADGGYRKGRVFPLKPTVDEAIGKTAGSVENVLVVKRAENDVDARGGPRPLVARDRGERHRPSTRPRPSTPSIRCSSSTRRAPPASPRASCTRAAATSPRPRSRTSTCSTCTPRPTCTGAPPTSAGSPGTPTWSTARSRTVPPRCSTRARPTPRTRAAGGRSSRSTRSRSSTPRPRPSARS